MTPELSAARALRDQAQRLLTLTVERPNADGIKTASSVSALLLHMAMHLNAGTPVEAIPMSPIPTHLLEAVSPMLRFLAMQCQANGAQVINRLLERLVECRTISDFKIYAEFFTAMAIALREAESPEHYMVLSPTDISSETKQYFH